MENDKEINQIIRTVKELFIKNKCNSKKLSNLIDKYLIPQELEKKNNAEFSTPYNLRQEMLNIIPLDFWKEPKKIFEPCCGKGGFLIDIIDRFMNGLKKRIKNKEERYKFIVEECLYWSDINPTNIYICKLLINPDNKYNIKYNTGNTLELNIKEKWDLDNFDGIIGNPPYNKGKNSNFYTEFIDYAKINLVDNGYILYVVPNRFLIPKHKANKCINKFDIKIIKHTVKNFNVSTDIGYFLGINKNNIINDKVKCIFKDNIEYEIDLNIPTPSANDTVEFKKLSDKILINKKKINFIKSNKDDIEKNKYIFIPRHWTRYSSKKDKGGKHIFNIINDFSDDGRFIKVKNETKENIIWYLTRSKIIRFITNNYASTVFIPPFIWESIPKIDFKKKYDDNKLYELFNLSNEEKLLIERSVD